MKWNFICEILKTCLPWFCATLYFFSIHKMISISSNSIYDDPLAETILMVVYSSLDVPGTEFIPLNGEPLPTCLSETEPYVVGSNNATILMRPAVVRNKGDITVEPAF